MHSTMDDLLALRAGEGSAWARQHAAGCAACQAELEALYQRVAQLKALPTRRPARDRDAVATGPHRPPGQRQKIGLERAHRCTADSCARNDQLRFELAFKAKYPGTGS